MNSKEEEQISYRELSEKVSGLIDLTEQFSKAIILGSAGLKEEYLKGFTAAMLEVFPQIVVCYTRPEFEPVRDDMQYWVNQLKRMLEILQQKDLFLMIDAFYFETHDNLVRMKEMLDEVAG